MDHHGSMGSGPQSNNIIINDLLCFVFNNISYHSHNTICRLCLETYSSNDILQACSVLKDVAQGSGGISFNDVAYAQPLYSETMTHEEKAIRCILLMLKQKDQSTLPKFVSNGLHLPKINGFCDNKVIQPLLTEFKELKEHLLDQLSVLKNDLFNLRKELLIYKKPNQNDGFSYQNSMKQSEYIFLKCMNSL